MRSAVLVLLSFVSTACMLNPVDGQVLSSTTSTLSTAGYSNTANQLVQLEYGRGAAWVDGGTARTSSTVALVEDGVSLYSWSLPVTLPDAAWLAGTTGRFAKVRVSAPGAAAGGATQFFYSFRPDWSECRAANPGLGNFIANCQSPRSPVAYVYTPDFPAGADFTVQLFWSSTGRTEVRVRNGGRPGIVTRIECSRFGSASTMDVTRPLATGDSASFFSAVAPIGTVTCRAIGTNEDGTPEANTSNNTASNRF
jgi:hypothetical protein